MLSIKQEVFKLLSGFIILVIFMFTSLMYLNVNYGISTDTRNTLAYQGALLERSVIETGVMPELVNSEILSVYTDIEDMPLYVKESFSWLEMESGIMLEKQLYDDLDKGRYVYAMKYLIRELDKSIYIVSDYDEELEGKIRYEATIQKGNLIHIVTGIILIVLSVFLFSKILYWRLFNPVEQLFYWITSLDEGNAPSRKELKYFELIKIVDELKQNLKKQKEIIEKEEFFLRTLSHELRTPIAIISSSGELLERLAIPNDTVERATGRIMYAVKNMKTLVQTLLWLSRKNETPLSANRINLSTMIGKIVEDNMYLSQDREIRLNMDRLDTNAELLDNYSAIQLVLENLIRNAIQYTYKGEITLEASSYIVTIKNPLSMDTTTTEVESYGIGLFLVEKICSAKKYKFELVIEKNTVIAKVTFIPLITD